MNLGVGLFGTRTRGLDVVLELYPPTSTPGVLYVSVVLYLFVYVFTWHGNSPACVCMLTQRPEADVECLSIVCHLSF